jgi:hypothetical protein
MTVVKQGTLIIDNGKVGIVIKVYKIGSTSYGKESSLIHWEESYHIFYSDGTFSYINKSSFEILVNTGDIKIL